MPEFVLNTEGAAEFENMSDLEKGFVEAMFFLNQCSPGVIFEMPSMKTRWAEEGEIDHQGEPQPTVEDWWHPEIQSGIEEGTLDGYLPSDCGVSDMAESMIKDIQRICKEFLERAGNDAESAANIYGWDRVGNDLFYTMSGAGVGFWCRNELPEELQDRLSAACDRSEVNVYYAEDGKIYLE